MPSEHRIRGKYHILDFPLPGAWADKLLGRIVFDKANPISYTAPSNDGPNGSSIPQNIVPEIASDRVPYSTLSYLLNDFKDVEQNLKLTHFFEERAAQATSATHIITAINAERIDMSNIPDKLEMLWANETYKKAAEKMLWQQGHTQKLGMVTGIYVSKSLTVQVEDSKDKAIGAHIKAPISEAMGDPTGTLDVSAGAQYEAGKTRTEQFDIDVPCVFAVAYTEVGLRPVQRKSEHKKSRFFRIPGSKKLKDDVEYEIYVDTTPGAKLFAGSSGSSESDNESEAGSTTSTRVDSSKVAGTSDTANDEGSEIRSTASTNVEEPRLVENAPYVFKSPQSVFGNA
ncbi:uncharacterized protein LY89DRAFT_692566 [Mollisia scopiformis]|uniref:Uncharacterized protein n=1 Tax=Mollisia scopiformis TaxID=149040 RepID=A0A132B264_MOLSC|nr:uncharacterized protein LY89DRAFT_692566 [Mollisia scopiformis]KUJ06333.1 hypothetical protein LY89DRAFT_692566 [Mollisia scopiformis]